jgi:hypothetical protein
VRHLISICILAFTVTAAMAQAPRVRIPDESAGIDGITRTLITGFDQFDILALGEAHGNNWIRICKSRWCVIPTLSRKCAPS